MSDTPRTDAMEQCGDCVDDLRTAYGNLLSFARELERENTKLIGALVELRDKTSCTQGQYAILDDALDEERKRADDGYRSGMETAGF